MKKRYSLASMAAVVVLAAGCASVDTSEDWQTVQQQAQQRTGVQPNWVMHQDQVNADAMARQMMQDGLTRDEAIAIALSNNPELQAQFEQLGIARADLAQAGLFTNPSVGAVFRRPDGGGSWNHEASLMLPISDLWMVPLRKDAAEAAMAATTHQTLSEIVSTTAQVQKAYTQALYTQELTREAHNGGQPLQAASMQTMTTINKRELSRLMGLDTTDYDLACDFGNPAPRNLDVNALLSQAESNNPNLTVRDNQIAQYEKSLTLQKWRVLGDVNMGVGALRDPLGTFDDHDDASDVVNDAEWYYGPAVSLQLPIFDQNQAGIAKAEHALHQAKMLQQAERNNIRARVRSAVDRYNLYQAQAGMLGQGGAGSGQLYADGSGNLRELSSAQLAYLESVHGMLDALAELEQITGSRLLTACEAAPRMELAPMPEAASAPRPTPVPRMDGPRIRLEIIDADVEHGDPRANESTIQMEVQDAEVEN